MLTPPELLAQTLAAGAAVRTADMAVQRTYAALHAYVSAHYPDLDLSAMEKRSTSTAKRASLAEDGDRMIR